MSQLAQVAAEVSKSLRQAPQANVHQSRLAALSGEVAKTLRQRHAAVDREAEWQRVHSYIADVLKDTHVLYAKLARLEGDFAGEELARLERVSEAVLALGNELSSFSKAFYDGKYDMAQTEFAYGEESSGGGGEAPSPAPEESPIVPAEGEEEALLVQGEQGGQGEEQSQEGQQ